MTEKNPSTSLPTFGAPPDVRLIAVYKLISGNAWYDLERRVNAFLETPGNEAFQPHGDIQMYSGNEYVQTLVGYKYVD